MKTHVEILESLFFQLTPYILFQFAEKGHEIAPSIHFISGLALKKVQKLEDGAPFFGGCYLKTGVPLQYHAQMNEITKQPAISDANGVALQVVEGLTLRQLIQQPGEIDTRINGQL